MFLPQRVGVAPNVHEPLLKFGKLPRPLGRLGITPKVARPRPEAIWKFVLGDPLQNSLPTLGRSLGTLLLEVNHSSLGKSPTLEAERKSPMHPKEPEMRGVQPKNQIAIARQPKPEMRMTLGPRPKTPSTLNMGRILPNLMLGTTYRFPMFLKGCLSSSLLGIAPRYSCITLMF